MTSVALFTVTRLEGIPRSTPLVHALILTAGLLATRLVMRVLDDRRRVIAETSVMVDENVIMIGATQRRRCTLNCSMHARPAG